MGSFTVWREVFTYLARGGLNPTLPLHIGPDIAVTNNAQIKPPRISIAVRAWNEAAVIRSALFKGDEHFSPTNPHIRFFTGKMLSQLTASAGFVQIETTTCGLNKPRRDLMVATHILLKARKR